MDNRQDFQQYLIEKGKKQAYIDMCKELLDSLYDTLDEETSFSKAIDSLVRRRWSGYVSKDRATYQILNDYADFCDSSLPVFTAAFREHISETFEGEARKAMRAYKDALVSIPIGTIIAADNLHGLSNEEFIDAFGSLQDFIRNIYSDIESGSPFGWGWPGWKAIAAEGINQNRIMMVLSALVGSGTINKDVLVVDKKSFGGYDICKPFAKTKLMLDGFVRLGLCIDGLTNNKATSFTVSCPNTPNLITVLYAYFKNPSNQQWRVFSYRFVEDKSTQTRETFFLAKTDGLPINIQEMHYWLYDEALKYGYIPQGNESAGCYVYKKGTKVWLLIGSGSSYHEDEFLHSPNYTIAAKPVFHRVFQTHPEKIDALRKRFPHSFGRIWTRCWTCKTEFEKCKMRVKFELEAGEYYHCAKGYLFFHDPNFDDVKAILELYKLENNLLQQ